LFPPPPDKHFPPPSHPPPLPTPYPHKMRCGLCGEPKVKGHSKVCTKSPAGLRRAELIAALDAIGCELRDDSALCDNWISGKETVMTAEMVAERMAEMKYLHEGFCQELEDLEAEIEQAVEDLGERVDTDTRWAPPHSLTPRPPYPPRSPRGQLRRPPAILPRDLRRRDAGSDGLQLDEGGHRRLVRLPGSLPWLRPAKRSKTAAPAAAGSAGAAGAAGAAGTGAAPPGAGAAPPGAGAGAGAGKQVDGSKGKGKV
jgi:hypothetical protein